MDNFIEPTREDRLRAAKLKVLSIIAAGLLFLGLHYGKSFVKALPVCDKAPYLVAGLCVGVALPCLMALWLLRVALKAHKHQQMPPPGMLIWTRTRLYRGRAAVVRARLLLLGGAVLLALSLWLVVMVTHVAHGALSLQCECKDFLSVLHVKPPHVHFVKCEPEAHRQGKPLKATYRVSGAHAVQAEAFFVRLAKMPPMKKSCCQWDGPPGQFTGKDGRIYSVYMTSAETTVNNRKQWRDIVSFEIVVETLTEEI